MSGQGQLYLQPSELYNPADLPAGQWARGIPTPGIPSKGVPAVDGVADCKNLVAASPPTLLCEFEIYSYSIEFSFQLANSGAWGSAPTLIGELALLINDRVAYSTTEHLQTLITSVNTLAVANGSFTSDLVNPIRLGARERLGLRIGINPLEDAPLGFDILVGAQLASTITTVVGGESTISYNVIDLPGSRRL